MSKRNRALRSLAERERRALMEWVWDNSTRLSWRYDRFITRQFYQSSDLWLYDLLFNERLR